MAKRKTPPTPLLPKENIIEITTQPQHPHETPIFDPNLTLDQILSDLKGFGIEDTEEPITLKASGRLISVKLSNLPNETEIEALMAAEGLKGHIWISRIKCDILAKSISWLNGVNLKEDAGIFVTSPITGIEGHIRPVLRDMILGWGQETVNILWRILMKHCQGIEDRLYESLPDASVMTEVERRFLAKAMEEVSEVNREVLKETVQSIVMGEE